MITVIGRSFLVLIISVFLTSCSTMTLDSDVQVTPLSETGTHTKHGSFYEFVWSEPSADKCEPDEGFARVRYHTNALYALISIASLGLYVPQTVEWWCDGTVNGEDEEEEEYIPE